MSKKIDYTVQNTGGSVIISEEYFKELLEDSNILQMLRNCGIDNWEGYSEALSQLEDNFE